MKKKNNYITDNSHQLDIQFDVMDENTNQKQLVIFQHSKHSLIRSSQRGICNSKIAMALTFGHIYSKQGFNYYVLGEKDIPCSLSKEKSHIKNIVVVVSGDSNKVITCYKLANPVKHMKHKSDQFYKNYNNLN